MSSLFRRFGGGSKKHDISESPSSKSSTMTKTSSKGDLQNQMPDYGQNRDSRNQVPDYGQRNRDSRKQVPDYGQRKPPKLPTPPDSLKKYSALPKKGSNTSLEEQFQELSLPVRKKERSMSISKSGRHKYRSKQRATVITHEIYVPATSSEAGQASTAVRDSRTQGLGAPLSRPTGQPTSV